MKIYINIAGYNNIGFEMYKDYARKYVEIISSEQFHLGGLVYRYDDTFKNRQLGE